MLTNFEDLLQKAKTVGTLTVSVAQAEDEELLKAIKIAQDLGLIYPVLVGDKNKIEQIAKDVELKKFEIVNTNNDDEIALEAVKVVKSGNAQVLMKGLVNTSIFLRAVLNKEYGLRTGRLLSLLAVYELPGYHKLLYCTDSGVNVNPNIEQKKDILTNALYAMQGIGFDCPKVAVLSSNEMVDPKIPSTVDAAQLVYMVKNNIIPNCIIEGPVAFDVAFDAHAAEHKGIDSKISSDVDLLVFPNIETGNVLGKSWLHFNKAKWAGIILGSSSPIILGSRSDTADVKLNSIALACLSSKQI
jgi:phosphate butyryltransferase